MRTLLSRALLAAALLAPSAALAAKHVISGVVLDRNGDPVERVNVTLVPGNVEIITDDDGRFAIDYLRDDEGNRVKLGKRTEYKVKFFKVGFHETEQVFFYKRGELALEPVTLKEDTIRLDPSVDDIDPSRFPERAQSGGGSYEGE